MRRRMKSMTNGLPLGWEILCPVSMQSLDVNREESKWTPHRRIKMKSLKHLSTQRSDRTPSQILDALPKTRRGTKGEWVDMSYLPLPSEHNLDEEEERELVFGYGRCHPGLALRSGRCPPRTDKPGTPHLFYGSDNARWDSRGKAVRWVQPMHLSDLTW